MTLTAHELSDMRDDAELLLPSTCTILELTTTPDDMGGYTQSWGTAGTAISCRLDAMSATMRAHAEADQFTVHSGWVLFVPYDQAIATGNRVVISSDTYNVMGVDDDHDWRALRRAFLDREDH